MPRIVGEGGLASGADSCSAYRRVCARVLMEKETTTSPVVVVLTKRPTPGLVKTRLIGPLTAEEAAEVHRRCFEATLSVIAAVPDIHRVVAISPGPAGTPMEQSVDAEWIDQGEGDLGERLERAVWTQFRSGRSPVLAVGSDCPTMTPEDFLHAFNLLRNCDVVIGPAVDGGYYLLGLRQPAPSLFAGIDWSTSAVAEQTRARAREACLSVAELPVRRDVDEYEDLRVLMAGLPDTEGSIGSLKRYLRAVLDRSTNGESRG